jgi:hypothetical protein
MAVFSVLIGPVEHDGERYEEGAQVTLNADEAKPLVALGVIGAAEAPKRKRTEAES